MNRPFSIGAWRGTCAVCVVGAFVVLASGGCRDELPPKPRVASGSQSPALPPAPAGAPQRHLPGRRVLLVHSYHPEYAWVDTITQASGTRHRARAST